MMLGCLRRASTAGGVVLRRRPTHMRSVANRKGAFRQPLGNESAALFIGASIVVGASVYFIFSDRRTALADAGVSPAAAAAGGTAESAAAAPVARRKRRIVVLGSGPAAMSVVAGLKGSEACDVIIVSPRSHLLLTPLLTQVAVGKISASSAMQPLGQYLGGNVSHLQMSCTHIDPTKQTVQCCGTDPKQQTTLEYDRLVIAVGGVPARVNTPGVKEHCLPLTELEHSLAVRQRLRLAFDAAAGARDAAEKQRLLHFVVVSEGAVGRELAAELLDYAKVALAPNYPTLDTTLLKISLIDSGAEQHNVYDMCILDAAKARFKRAAIDERPHARVERAESTHLLLKTAAGTAEKIPFSVCVWATTPASSPLVKDLCAQLPSKEQPNKLRLLTDDCLRVLGARYIYAIGDCATVSQERLIKQWMRIFSKLDVNHDNNISQDEFQAFIANYQSTYPQLRAYKDRTLELFEKADTNKDGTLQLDEFQSLLTSVASNLTKFPTSAQTAIQQGEYLASVLKEEHAAYLSSRRGNKSLLKSKAKAAKMLQPFRYKHMGGFEYVGSDVDITERGAKGDSIISNNGAWWLWRSWQTSQLYSWATRGSVLWQRLSHAITGPETF